METLPGKFLASSGRHNSDREGWAVGRERGGGGDKGRQLEVKMDQELVKKVSWLCCPTNELALNVLKSF